MPQLHLAIEDVTGIHCAKRVEVALRLVVGVTNARVIESRNPRDGARFLRIRERIAFVTGAYARNHGKRRHVVGPIGHYRYLSGKRDTLDHDCSMPNIANGSTYDTKVFA